MSTTNKALAARFHRDLFEQGDPAAADQICAPDFVWRAVRGDGAGGLFGHPDHEG
jgi:hypothetical protein